MAYRVSDFAAVSHRICGWTTNFLATAIVLVGGLAMGWQVLAWWHDAPPDASPTDQADSPQALPEYEFLTRHGPLRVERVTGDERQAMLSMQAFCRSVTVSDTGEPGAEEKNFVARLADATPLEEKGGVALYQPPGQMRMVVAVNRSHQRIAAWSFALPSPEGHWSVYHFQPAPLEPAR